MLERYIILRDLEPAMAHRGTRSAANVESPNAIEVHAEELRQNEAAELKNKDISIRAMAPSVPIALIDPTARKLATPAASRSSAFPDPIAWGVRAVGADRSQYDGQGVTVAVLDTGIQRNHKAFEHLDVVEWDFTGTGNGDTDGHGTHCAGTFFGGDVDGIRIGVACGISRALICKVIAQDKPNTSESVVDALMWAAREGAEVISMSLGIDFPGYVKLLIEGGLPPEIATSRALIGYRSTLMLFERIASLVRTLTPN